jgi:diadenosine tetraphosphate (Ap4A) HIT family hydrolase
MIIFSSENFVVEAHQKPHIDRIDGGHIRISPKVRIRDRQELSPKLAIELMRLTIVAGKAMKSAMNKQGVDIERINYQDNGNWSVFSPEGPFFHIHLYGRAKSAKIQKYGEACYFPHKNTHPEFYKNLKPLNSKDNKAIAAEIQKIFQEEEFSDKKWGL